MKRCWVVWAVLSLPWPGAAFAGPKEGERCGEERPKVSLRLGCAHGSGVPGKDHCARTGGGNFVVRQPSPDVLVISMTGRAQAAGNPFASSTAHFSFELDQSFTVVCESPDVRQVSLQVQGYAMGLLRSPCKGSASLQRASALLRCDGNPAPVEVVSFSLPARTVGPKENESVYLRSDRLCVPALPVCYTLHQTFEIVASEPKGGFPGRGAGADFSTSEDESANVGGVNKDPFQGARRRDFGFHVIVRAVPVPLPGTLPGEGQRGKGQERAPERLPPGR